MFALFFLPARRRQGRATQRWLAGLVVAAGVVAFGTLSPDLGAINTLGTVFMYLVVTQAWNILGGYGGYLNFGMVTYFGIGAYAGAVLFRYFGLSPFLTAPAAGAAAALFGLLIGIPTLRLRGAYFAVVTIIITFAVQLLALDLPLTQGALGIFLSPLPLDPITVERLFYFVFLGLAALATALVFAVENSNFGWALVAIREDEDAAEVIGVRTTAVKWVANVVAAFITGLVGGIYAQRILYIEPTGTFALDISLNVVLMAVIGGAGTWQGPVIGVPLVLIVAEALRVTVTSEVNRVIFSVVVILIALFVPGGIMGLLRQIKRRPRPLPDPAAGAPR